MFKLVAFCLLLTEALSNPINGSCRQAFISPVQTSGSATTTVTAMPTANCGAITTSQIAPFVTEIVPALQFGDVTVGGDIPIGGSIKVSGYIPVYGAVSLDGIVPSAGTACINTGALVTQVESCCRC